MPLYTFYPCRVDDASLSFQAYELADDDQAGIRALGVLEEHASAEFVVVWCGDRKLLTQYRDVSQPKVSEGEVLGPTATG